MNNTVLDINVQVFVRIYFFVSHSNIPRTGSDESYIPLSLTIMRKFQTIFQSDCTILFSHQKCMRGSNFFLHSHDSTCYCLSDYRYPRV